MPLKFNFVNRQEICREIKDLDLVWRSVENDVTLRTEKYSECLSDFELIKKQVEESNQWIDEYKKLDQDYEKYYLDKMMDGLKKYEQELEVKVVISFHHFHTVNLHPF